MYLTHADLSDYYCCDIEAESLTPKHMWCAVVKNVGTKQVWQFHGPGIYEELRKFINERPAAYWVGHNFISYDAPVIRRLCDAVLPDSHIVDTLVLSYLYHPTMPGGHSLGAYGERFGFEKDEYDDFTRFSPELLRRCVVDVDLNIKVFRSLTKKMREVGFSERSCALEHKVRVIIDRQQKNGFQFDVQRATELYAKLRQTEAELGEPIRVLFPPVLIPGKTYNRRIKADGGDFATYLRHVEQYPKIRHSHVKGTYTVYDWQEFNIGSPQQRLSKLLSLGFVPSKRTKGGGPSVDEESLVEFAKESGRPEVQAIADWLVVNSRAGMVNSWLDAVQPDGCIHGRVNSCGANSRRMTHSGPNTANIPSNEAKYGREARGLWVARPGRRLVGYDAASAQMRCFAHFLPDPKMGIRFYTEGHDPHQENADLIGIKRKPIKNVFYANMFGAFPPKLASTAGFVGSRQEAEEYGTWIQSELYRVTPGLRDATLDAQEEFNQTPEHWMRCVDGGYVRGKSEHSAFNYRIQPAEACLMKQAMVFIDERCRDLDHLKVGDIHDEGQHDSNPKDAEELGKRSVQAIKDAGEELGFRVPMDGNYSVGTSWAETH